MLQFDIPTDYRSMVASYVRDDQTPKGLAGIVEQESMTYEEMLSLHKIMRDQIRSKWERVLPFNEEITDRWEKAQHLGFGKGLSSERHRITATYGHHALRDSDSGRARSEDANRRGID